MEDKLYELSERLTRAEKRCARATCLAIISTVGCSLLLLSGAVTAGTPTWELTTVRAPFKVVNSQGRKLLEVVDIEEGLASIYTGPRKARSGTEVRVYDADGRVTARLDTRFGVGTLSLRDATGGSEVIHPATK